MLTMTKRGADLSKTNGFSLRNLFSIAKEKVKSIIKEMYETQKEFDEELKRVDWMEESAPCAGIDRRCDSGAYS